MIIFIFGVAFATMIAASLTGAIGKLVGCGLGSRVTCIKAIIDLVLTILLCNLNTPILFKGAALAIAVISLGGMVREFLKKDAKCNCFGVLTKPMEPLKNPLRFILIGSALFVLNLDIQNSPYPKDFYQGVLAGAAVLFSVVIYFFSLFVVRGFRVRKEESRPRAIQGHVLSNSISFSMGPNGTRVPLEELIKRDKTTAIIFTSPNCLACNTVKDDISPVLENFSFPIYYIEDEISSNINTGENILFDISADFRSSLDLRSFPAMVLIDGPSMTVRKNAALGHSEILRDLIHVELSE